MTFAARPPGYNLKLGVQSPIPIMTVRDVKPFVTATASITFGSDGAITYAGNQSNGPSQWHNPVTAGTGNSFWIRFILVFGSAWDSGLVSNTVYQLNTARSLVWTATASTSKSSAASVQIYTDAGGTVLVASGTINVYSSGMN